MQQLSIQRERERDRDNYVCYKYSFKLNIYIFFGNISILLFIIKIYSQTLFNHSHKHCMHTRYKECRNLSHFARKIIFFSFLFLCLFDALWKSSRLNAV